MGNTRAEYLHELARGFREYLIAQTEIDLVAVGRDAERGATIVVAFERLDLALAQIADLSSIYGDDSRGVLDPLVAPTAALAGEYLRQLAGAAWSDPDPELPPDDTLTIVLTHGIAIDLHGVARAALASPSPSIGPLIAGLLT